MAAVPMVREKLDDSKNEMPHQANPSGYPEKLIYEGIRFTTDTNIICRIQHQDKKCAGLVRAVYDRAAGRGSVA